MRWRSWFKLRYRHEPASTASRIKCPKCGKEMHLEDKDTSSGSDMRTYRCDYCKESHIVDFGTAIWKVLSDVRKSE
jgi:predicted RNA-binding Zn-ribbon protein involved in translation (DUF1610 family)